MGRIGLKKKNKLYGAGWPKGSFKRMVEVNQGYNKTIDYKEKLYREEERRMKLLEEFISDIPIRSVAFWSNRVLNCFGRAKIKTLGDLRKWDISLKHSLKMFPSHLLDFRNFGKKSLMEVRDKLSRYLFYTLFERKE